MTEIAAPGLQRIDEHPIADDPSEIRAFLVVRNEALRLPAILQHHRRLGVSRYFVVDNGSTDDTVRLLSAERDVHLFSTNESYAASRYGLTWLNALLDRYGSGHWSLSIDADELLIYPHCERADLTVLCRYLDDIGVQALLCLLLDMYSDRPFYAISYTARASLIETCPFFDSRPYRMVPAKSFPHVQIYGGVRERVFRHMQARGPHPPTVSKVPLVKWQAGMQYLLSTHALTPVPISSMIGALLHFKFLGDFPDRAAVEAERGEHFDHAREYLAYRDLLQEEKALNLLGENSQRFVDSRQLVKLGLMRSLPAYERFVANPPLHRPEMTSP